MIYEPLEDQRVWTAELGVRGTVSRFSYGLVVYLARVRDELLELNDVTEERPRDRGHYLWGPARCGAVVRPGPCN